MDIKFKAKYAANDDGYISKENNYIQMKENMVSCSWLLNHTNPLNVSVCPDLCAFSKDMETRNQGFADRYFKRKTGTISDQE